MKQMAVAGGNFHPAEAAALQTRGGLCKVLYHLLNFRDSERTRHGAAQIIGQGRCAHGFRIASRFVAAAAGILYLSE